VTYEHYVFSQAAVYPRQMGDTVAANPEIFRRMFSSWEIPALMGMVPVSMTCLMQTLAFAQHFHGLITRAKWKLWYLLMVETMRLTV
jgi:hypothetical protein